MPCLYAAVVPDIAGSSHSIGVGAAGWQGHQYAVWQQQQPQEGTEAAALQTCCQQAALPLTLGPLTQAHSSNESDLHRAPIQCVQKLLLHSADEHTQDTAGATALWIATSEGHGACCAVAGGSRVACGRWVQQRHHLTDSSCCNWPPGRSAHSAGCCYTCRSARQLRTRCCALECEDSTQSKCCSRCSGQAHM